VIDATGQVLIPGFVDTHRHVWQAPLRGIGPDLTLPGYFEVVLGRALSAYRPEDTHLAVRLGAAEALDAGITTVLDWNNTTHAEAVADAYQGLGMRAVIAGDQPRADLTGTLSAALAILGPEYGPADEAEALLRRARDLGILVTMHIGGGRTPSAVSRMDEAGLLGPGVHLVHLNSVTADEAELLADTGAGVTVTPLVEELMGHGVSAYGRLADAGCRPALGVDVVVNSVPDLFEVMRATLRAERTRAVPSASAPMLAAARMLDAATVDGARALGLIDRIGTIAVGKRADLVLLDGLAHLAGSADCAGAVVTSLRPSDVDTVIVDGRIVKRSGRLVDVDLAALRASAADLGRRALGAPAAR
ncbi:amidohydrolase family protein, partial [Hamadaea sp. NPDC051192]|uniref:amidohydrolase family protein n=1 Tax=Hamadaea sp. NPDC051192 TaxID=3154940 RepID=UPI0034156A15